MGVWMVRKKQPLSESDAVTLTKKQQRVVFSLAGERKYIQDEANKQIREINEALEELARTYAVRAGWAEEGEYYFDQAGPGDPIVLRRVGEEEGQGDKGTGGQGE